MSAAAAIFDLDGTLFDTFDEHFDAWRAVCADHAVPLSPAQFEWSFGRRNEEIIPVLWREAGRAEPSIELMAEIAERKESLFRDRFLKSPRLLPGAVELLCELRCAGWRRAAGSSAPAANVEAFLSCIPAGARLDATVSGDDVTHGKPHPEVFLLAAKRLGAPPAECVVFEDAPAGVEAARRAGMRSIAVVSRGRTRESLAAADVLIDDFRGIVPKDLETLVRSGSWRAR